MISATIILDSINEFGNRLTTFELVLPKDFLAQLNTHRSLSKNAASARAIPIAKFIQSVSLTPVMPVWTYNKAGMVGERIIETETLTEADRIWLEARDNALESARKLQELGVHKQTTNRLLGPWFYTKVICTATDLGWFFQLRDSGSAQEEIAILARAMKEAMNASTPKLLSGGEWHLPFVLPEEEHLDHWQKVRISVARCARVSYQTHDNDKLSTLEKDIALFDMLKNDGHFSPFEHQATPYLRLNKEHDELNRCGNFYGWHQYRKELDL